MRGENRRPGLNASPGETLLSHPSGPTEGSAESKTAKPVGGSPGDKRRAREERGVGDGIETRPTITLHPTYDPVTKTFFLVKPKCEAPTIAGLLQKLGPGYAVQDYYPNGIPFGMLPRGMSMPGDTTNMRKPVVMATTGPRAHTARRKPAGESFAPPLPQEPSPTKTNVQPSLEEGEPSRRKIAFHYLIKGKMRPLDAVENRALDLWAQGMMAKEIAQIVGQKLTWVSSWLVPMARKRGDPRAVIRNPKSVARGRPSRSGSDPSSSPQSGTPTDPDHSA